MRFFYFFVIYSFYYSFSFAQVASRIVEGDIYTATRSEAAALLYNDAIHNFEIKNFKEAISLNKQAILIDTTFIDAYDNLGLCYRQINKLDSASYYYNISRIKYPKGVISIMNLALIEQIKGDNKKAINYYDQMIIIEPENPEGYYGASGIKFQLGEDEEAIKYGLLAEKYYKNIESPYIGDCYKLLCVLYINTNNMPLAKKYHNLAKKAGIKIEKEIEERLK